MPLTVAAGSRLFGYTFSSASAASSGLDWDGTGAVRRMLYWSSPFQIYDATYLFKVYPRLQVTGVGDLSRYYTTFFWGNNGIFYWDSSNPNTYYGAHPYPDPANTGDGKWEISVDGIDDITRDDASSPFVSWGQWHSQAFVAWRESASITHHKFYVDLPSVTTANTVTTDIDRAGWANTDPPSPAIVVGQAPDNGSGQSWGGYSRWEEANEIIRGLQFYNSRLTESQITQLAELETDAAVLAKCSELGIAAPWYLNMNPTPTDVLDKSGNGHHPAWEGAGRPSLWTQ